MQAILSTAYVVFALYEKVAYGCGVLVYKSVIRLLLQHTEACEKYRALAREENGLLEKKD
jgi:hypothetical protein